MSNNIPCNESNVIPLSACKICGNTFAKYNQVSFQNGRLFQLFTTKISDNDMIDIYTYT